MCNFAGENRLCWTMASKLIFSRLSALASTITSTASGTSRSWSLRRLCVAYIRPRWTVYRLLDIALGTWNRFQIFSQSASKIFQRQISYRPIIFIKFVVSLLFWLLINSASAARGSAWPGPSSPSPASPSHGAVKFDSGVTSPNNRQSLNSPKVQPLRRADSVPRTLRQKDGPCRNLLEFMARTNYEAPADWKGVRKMSS